MLPGSSVIFGSIVAHGYLDLTGSAFRKISGFAPQAGVEAIKVL